MAEYNGPVELLDVDGSVADAAVAELTTETGDDGAPWEGLLTLTAEAARDLIDAPGEVTLRLPDGATAPLVPVKAEGPGDVHVRGVGPAPF